MWEYTKNNLSLVAHTLGTTRQQIQPSRIKLRGNVFSYIAFVLFSK